MNFRQRLRNLRREDRGWPRYMPGGRVRTSTVGLLIAFILLSWLQQAYEPPARPPDAPAQQVVPPGFVPDPDYTWVPRTQVQEPTTTRRPTTTTPTTTTTPPTTTTTTSPTSPTSPLPSTPTTTVTDPDGPGLLPPQTVIAPPATTPTSAPPPPLFPGLPGLPG